MGRSYLSPARFNLLAIYLGAGQSQALGLDVGITARLAGFLQAVIQHGACVIVEVFSYPGHGVKVSSCECVYSDTKAFGHLLLVQPVRLYFVSHTTTAL